MHLLRLVVLLGIDIYTCVGTNCPGTNLRFVVASIAVLVWCPWVGRFRPTMLVRLRRSLVRNQQHRFYLEWRNTTHIVERRYNHRTSRTTSMVLNHYTQSCATPLRIPSEMKDHCHRPPCMFRFFHKNHTPIDECICHRSRWIDSRLDRVEMVMGGDSSWFGNPPIPTKQGTHENSSTLWWRLHRHREGQE